MTGGQARRTGALAGLFLGHVLALLVVAPCVTWCAMAPSFSSLWADVCKVVSGSWADSELWTSYHQWASAVVDSFSGQWERWPLPVFLLVTALGPALLVAPLVGPLREQPVGRSLRASAVGAGMLAGVLSCCVLLALYDLAWLALEPVLGLTNANTGTTQGGVVSQGWLSLWNMVIVWVVAGGVWTLLFLRAGRSRHPQLVVRWFRWLLAGTAVEVALSATVLVWARRRDSCVCDWGTFWALVWGLTSLVLLCGPAGVLLLTRRARQQWGRAACPHCGYPRRTDSHRCSECGAQLDPAI